MIFRNKVSIDVVFSIQGVYWRYCFHVESIFNEHITNYDTISFFPTLQQFFTFFFMLENYGFITHKTVLKKTEEYFQIKSKQ